MIDRADPSAQGPLKTLMIALDLGVARDVSISPRAVVVRALGDARHHGYFASAGPFMVRWLLNTLQLRSLTSPMLASMPSRMPYAGRATRPQLAWLLPKTDGLEIRFRPMPLGLVPVEPRPIPSTGELALPAPWHAPPAWTPPKIDVEHAMPIACPHCGVDAPRHRSVSGSPALVCASCGRSFVPEPAREPR